MDDRDRVVRATFTEVEVSGIVRSICCTSLIVAAARAFPANSRVALRWCGETRSATVEDCFPDGGRFLLWLDVQPVPVPAGAARLPGAC